MGNARRTMWCICTLLFVSGAQQAQAQVRADTTKKKPPVDTLRKDTVTVAVPIPRAASARTDSLAQAKVQARIDSTARARLADTLRAPIAQFESPRALDVSNRLHFTREQILSSGAINIADLLDHVPGVTTFRSGWLAGIHAASLHGDFARVRIFVDGVEMDAPETRNGGALDLDDVPLWTLDDLIIERAAGEVRVWLRSWSVRSITPYTRADIFTGDLNTNAFRALFARRYRNGMIFQVGAQQLATQSGQVSAFSLSGTRRSAGDGNQQVINLRLGWSRRRFSLDLYGTANARDRDPQTARKGFVSLPAFKGARRDAYVRVGYGDTLRGFWSQAMLGIARTRLDGVRDTAVKADSGKTLARADTIGSITQQIVAVGFRASRYEWSVTDRARPIRGTWLHAPALRVGYGTAAFNLGAFVERRGIDSTTGVDVFARAAPRSWLVVTAAQSNRAPSSTTARPSFSSTRAEGAVRLVGLWFGGGVVREGSTVFNSPSLFAVASVQLPANAATGVLGSIRGPLYKDVSLDLQAIKWNGSQYGRPQVHVRTELSMVSSWLSKFPKGQFGINARFIYEQRDPVPFYFGVDTKGLQDVRTTQASQVLTGMLQIRIQRASIFYQYRNLTGGDYEHVPGLTMPPAVQMYGVRWEFAN